MTSVFDQEIVARTRALLNANPVVPVLASVSVEQIYWSVDQLWQCGFKTVEITLRSPGALAGLSQVKRSFPDMSIGAGTVCSTEQVEAATEAGADYLVSPGMTPRLLAAMANAGIAVLPGVATASDIVLGMEHGLQHFKFFPAVAAGGVDLLKAWAGPFPAVRFCPTGGLNASNFMEYLGLANVAAIGGTWLVRPEDFEHKRVDQVRERAAQMQGALTPPNPA